MIPVSPQLTEIQSEFGLATKNALAKQSLRTFYLEVFGGVNSGVSRQSDFAGKAKASVTGNMGVSISTNTVTLTVDVSAGGVDTTVIGQYQLANSQATPDPNNWSTLQSTTVSTDGDVDVSATIPDGTYFFQVTVYNGFNSHVDDRLEINTGDDTDRFDVDVAPPQLGQPTISGGTLEYSGVDGYMSFPYTDSEDAFVVEERIAGSSTETAVQDCDKNVGTANTTKEIRFGYTQFPSSSVEFRVKATASGMSDSQWSDWETATSVSSVFLPSCPL